MKRDMDVVRAIILAANEAEDIVHGVEGMEPQVFAYHVQLLVEAGLLVASIQGSGKRPSRVAMVFRLTWSGHDFADSIKEDTVWNKAKEVVMKPMASWSFDILLDYLNVVARGQIPGID